ncbi:MAG: glycosyltransferase family 2 protein [Desulfobulbales bacterium]
MEKPVSVIIPTYNRLSFLQKAVDSVLAQTYSNFELIIVDDGSEDKTPDLFADYDPAIVYLRQENKGPAAARNAGVKAAQHDLIAFLDSDDRFTEKKLAIQVKAMNENPTYLISHTQEIWYRNGRFLNQKKRHQKNHGDIFRQSLKLCAVGMSTVLMNREIFERYGLFDEEYPCCEDYEFWLRIGAEQRFLLVNEPLTHKSGGRDDQISKIYQIGMDRFRIKAIIKTLTETDLSDDQKKTAIQELEQKCRIYGEGCLKHGRLEEGQYYLDLPKQVRSRLTAC